jgi:alpha-tubulin suppressor-like RCC1 family protein
MMVACLAGYGAGGAATARGDTNKSVAPTATAISAGDNGTCALLNNGGVQCWGSNQYGQLGNNSTTDSWVPTKVAGLMSGVQAIAVGGQHACALLNNGGVQCWGSNQYGQLGNNSTTDSSVPVQVSGLPSGVQAITAGHSHTCALLNSFDVRCWGDNYFGELCTGFGWYSTVPVSVPVWSLPSGVQAITAGDGTTCALLSSGGLQCWGANGNGELGGGYTSNRSYVPVQVSGLTSGVKAVAPGSLHACALLNSGGVQCWGDNLYGQVGSNGPVDSLVPVPVFGSSVQAVAAGSFHTCALLSSGGVQCWGANFVGELGNNSTVTQSAYPVQVWGLTSGVQAISASNGFACALVNNGNVQCWGNNASGQLGTSPSFDSLLPVQVSPWAP